MDLELQFLINTIYGNKLNEKLLSRIAQMALSDPQYLVNMRKTALNKAKQLPSTNVEASTFKALKSRPVLTSVLHDAESLKPIELKSAANDMSAVDDFKQAFRQARLGGNKTFFWKKTKANPTGMFSTEIKPQGYNGEPKVNNNRVFLDTDKTDLPVFTGEYPEEFDVSSPRIPILGKIDLGIFNKQNPVEVNITDSNRIAGRKYGEGQKNANLYFGRKGMFANGGAINMEQLVTQLVQAAASGDQEATQQIEQIMQAAQQGDQLAVLIAQIILKVITAMQQQKGIKAQLGAKLNYLNKLKGICPEGTEKVYLAKGGCMCKQKASSGTTLKKEDDKKMNPVLKFKSNKNACGAKMKKNK